MNIRLPTKQWALVVKKNKSSRYILYDGVIQQLGFALVCEVLPYIKITLGMKNSFILFRKLSFMKSSRPKIERRIFSISGRHIAIFKHVK